MQMKISFKEAILYSQNLIVVEETNHWIDKESATFGGVKFNNGAKLVYGAVPGEFQGSEVTPPDPWYPVIYLVENE